MNRLLLVPACVLCFLCAFAQAQPLSTAFTFQGELRSAGNPVNGSYDMRFRLYDAPSGGAQVGTVLCSDNINITGGRFTVMLDFFLQFAGQKRFIEVEVRQDTGLDCTNQTGFTVLSPRQELTATPNATFALNAAVATLANTASTATTATNATQLNGQAAAFYQNAANLTSGSIPGARLNGAYPGVVQMDNIGNTFAGTGTGLHDLNASNLSLGTLSAARFPVPLSLSGASGPTNFILSANTTSPDFNAIGLYGSASAATGLTIGVEGRSDSTSGWANVGFATATTGFTHGVHGISSSTDGTGVYGIGTSTTGVNTGVWGETGSSTGRGVYGLASDPTGTGYGGYFQTNSLNGAALSAVAPSYAGVFRIDSPNGFAVRGTATASTGTTWGGNFDTNSSGGVGVQGTAQSSTGSGIGVYGLTSAPTGVGVRGHASLIAAGTSYGGYFSTYGSTGRGVYGLGIDASGGGANFGVYGEANGTAGTGVKGAVTATTGVTYGVRGQSDSNQGYGVYGESTATGTFDVGIGGYFASSSGSGIAVQGVSTGNGNGFPRAGYFTINGTAGAALDVSSSSQTGNGYGVRASSLGATGTAVYGSANLQGTGLSYGGRFECASSGGFAGYFRGRGGDSVYIENYGTGRGLHAIAPSDTAIWGESTGGLAGVHGATNNVNGYGVLGINGGTTGNSYGVVGQTGSSAGWGVFAFGRSGASGTKTFRIDHPDDPENKYLLHYSTESPEVLNAYSGKIVLDNTGEAVVELPPYFAKINKDPRYTLTAMGAPMPLLHIAEEISEDLLEQGAKAAPGQQAPLCSFRIAGGAPGAKVSWRIEAVRNDRWVQQHGAPVEVEKQGSEKGTYQHPELFGQPPEKGLNYQPAPSRPAPSVPVDAASN
jgi:hypothetical protein